MKLVWSNLAKAELAEIRRYSVDTWGRAAAIFYMRGLRNAAAMVAVDATRARPLREPWRIIRARSHYLICHCDDSTGVLTVARVLHTAQWTSRATCRRKHVPGLLESHRLYARIAPFHRTRQAWVRRWRYFDTKKWTNRTDAAV